MYKYWDVKNSVEAHNYAGRLKLWERIYLEEIEAGVMEEERGRARGTGKGRPRKQPLLSGLAKELIEEN